MQLNEIAEYWSEMAGTVHPADKAFFPKADEHGFKLDFPPPAFVGDVVNAPVIILGNQGGWDAKLTPPEQLEPDSADRYRDMLANPRRLEEKDKRIWNYYFDLNYSEFLADGTVALVNGVAYRAENGDAKWVKQSASILPSAKFHQRWLREALLPLVVAGDRLVVVHYKGRWNGATDVFAGCENVVFCDLRRPKKDLTGHELAAIKRYLRR